MVQLIIYFMNKSSILSLKDVVDENLTDQQRELRKERILNVTHEIFQKFQINVMVPKPDYIVKNSGANSLITTKKIGGPIASRDHDVHNSSN